MQKIGQGRNPSRTFIYLSTKTQHYFLICCLTANVTIAAIDRTYKPLKVICHAIGFSSAIKKANGIYIISMIANMPIKASNICLMI